jgi:PiT family inorganic phosphate transporter
MTAISSKHIASTHAESPKPHLDHPMGIRTILVFLAIMALGLFFAAYNIYRDISTSGPRSPAYCPFSCSASLC